MGGGAPELHAAGGQFVDGGDVAAEGLFNQGFEPGRVTADDAAGFFERQLYGHVPAPERVVQGRLVGPQLHEHCVG